MAGPAAPHGAAGAARPLHVLLRRAGRRVGGAGRAGRPDPRRRAQDGLAAERALGPEGGAGHSRPAPAPPRAGAGIGAAAQRARDLPDGGLPRLRRRIFSGAGRAAADVWQRPCRAVVGGRHADHDGLWRRRAGHAARPHGGGAGDDLRPRRVRPLDRYSGDRVCGGDAARQFPQDLGIRQQGAVLRGARARRPSPTSPTCCAPWSCRRAP